LHTLGGKPRATSSNIKIYVINGSCHIYRKYDWKWWDESIGSKAGTSTSHILLWQFVKEKILRKRLFYHGIGKFSPGEVISVFSKCHLGVLFDKHHLVRGPTKSKLWQIKVEATYNPQI
jgi:hypothetical protein